MVPFLFFFQALGALGFIREGIGSPIACAIVGRIFKIAALSNGQNLSVNMDAANPVTQIAPISTLMGQLQEQVLLVSLKEVYGLAVLASILFILMAIAMRYKKIVKYVRVPRNEVVRRLMSIRIHQDSISR